MLELMEIIEREYKKEKPHWTLDEYEEMFWLKWFGMRPCEWDGRELYLPKYFFEDNEPCAWEIFDDE
jgi:hypothetical protein